MKPTLLKLILFLFPIMLTSGCLFEEATEQDEKEDTPTYIPVSGGQPVTTNTVLTKSAGGTITVCEGTDEGGGSDYICYTESNRMWMSNCDWNSCSQLKVNVHYMLTDNLGTGNTVVVEAFDNHLFSGSPASVLRITNFDATRAGIHQEDYLIMEAGEYYVRAYIANDGSPPTPYQYGNMEIVSDQPFGLFGALSDATKVFVGPGEIGDVDIYLDKLFKTPGIEEPSNAHIRVVVTIDPTFEIPLSQEVRIELHNQEDFDYHPAYEFELPSESLSIEGVEGRAEYVSGQLNPADYFVFVWLDLSGNGYFDAGEPSQTYQLYGELGRVHIEKDKTVSIELNLE